LATFLKNWAIFFNLLVTLLHSQSRLIINVWTAQTFFRIKRTSQEMKKLVQSLHCLDIYGLIVIFKSWWIGVTDDDFYCFLKHPSKFSRLLSPPKLKSNQFYHHKGWKFDNFLRLNLCGTRGLAYLMRGWFV